VQIGSYLLTFRGNLLLPTSKAVDCLTLDDGTDRLSWNVSK